MERHSLRTLCCLSSVLCCAGIRRPAEAKRGPSWNSDVCSPPWSPPSPPTAPSTTRRRAGWPLALVDSGSDGVVVTGTTGEAPTLTIPEKIRLWSEVKDAVGARACVVAGSGDNCTADSVDLSREAARTGVDALLLTVPYYNKPTQEGLYRHFAAIADAVELPCIPYNVPGRTGVNMTAETQVRLSRLGNVVGVKEASGNLGQIANVVEGAAPGFRVWSGNDEDTFGVVALGGYGVISVASHFVGRQIADMLCRQLDGRVETRRRHPPPPAAARRCAVLHHEPDPREVRAQPHRLQRRPVPAAALRARRHHRRAHHGRGATPHDRSAARGVGRGRPRGRRSEPSRTISGPRSRQASIASPSPRFASRPKAALRCPAHALR